MTLNFLKPVNFLLIFLIFLKKNLLFQSKFINFVLLVRLFFLQFNLATFKVFKWMSVPIPTDFLNSFRIDNKIQPVPVPKSKKEKNFFLFKFFFISSTIASVSGLGIRVFLLTLKFI